MANKQMFDELERFEVEIKPALERFMNNEAIYVKFLKKFLDDPNYAELEQSLKDKNYEASLHCAHTLKGVCGNLGFMGLYRRFEKMVTKFRSADTADIDADFEELKPYYIGICDTIKENAE